MSASLKIVSLILFINFLIINQVQGGIHCSSGKVSVNLQLRFLTKYVVETTVERFFLKTKEVQPSDTIYSREIHSDYKYAPTPFNVNITVTKSVSDYYEFSVEEEIHLKIKCYGNGKIVKTCQETMIVKIPETCLSCNGRPKLCKGVIKLDTKKANIKTLS